MKRTFKLSTGVFGEGDPKICAPIVGRTKEDVFKAAEVIAKTEADEGGLLYDEIGSELKIRQIRKEKAEFLQSLELFYKVFFLGEDVE